MTLTFSKKQEMFLDNFTEEEAKEFDDLTLLRAMDCLAIRMNDEKRKFNLRSVIYSEANKINDKIIVEEVEPQEEKTDSTQETQIENQEKPNVENQV